MNFRYLIILLILIIFSRFMGRIFAYGIRFWYISIPVIIYLVYHHHQKRAKKTFKRRTHLDPEKEVKLKKDAEIKDEEDKDNEK